MADRFDLEDAITRFYSLKDNLEAIAEGLMEDTISTDEAVNALLGVGVLSQLLADKAFDTFKQTFKLDGYREGWAGQYTHAADADEELN
jgi:hypothetical protein